MKRCTLVVLAALFAAAGAHAAVVFTDLGTAAPPADLGGLPVTPFDQAPQMAIPELQCINSIPGSPIGGNIMTSNLVDKRTLGVSWLSWSHGYTGVVYGFPFCAGATPAQGNNAGAVPVGGEGGDTVILTLPAGATAFYLYVEPNNFDLFSVVVSAEASDGGSASSGSILVNGDSGANGFGFHLDNPGAAQIDTVSINVEPAAAGFAFGEFGISAVVPVELQSFDVEK